MPYGIEKLTAMGKYSGLHEYSKLIMIPDGKHDVIEHADNHLQSSMVVFLALM
jgi:hypothetical protein